MEQINNFTKGVVTDIDYVNIENSRLILPTENVRITEEGKGLVLSMIKGTNEAFSFNHIGITNPFIAGWVEVSGILYMIVTGNGKTAVLSYPSPRWIKYDIHKKEYYADIDNNSLYIGGFKDELLPLVVIKDQINQDRLLQFVIEGSDNFMNFNRKIRVIANKAYDNTTDLYLLSKEYGNFVINTCFDNDGKLVKERIYDSQSLRLALYQFPYNRKRFRIDSYQIQSAGNLRPGTYYFFIRYVDRQYNRYPIQFCDIPIYVFNIYKKDGSTFHLGMQERDWLDDSINYTNLALKLNLADIDNYFPYFEVGYVRYSSMVENATMGHDIKIIDRLYSSSEIVVTGFENHVELSVEELLHVNQYKGCMDALIENDIFIGVNFSSNKNSTIEDKVKGFAKSIVLGYEVGEDIEHPLYDQFRNNPFIKNAFNIPENISYKKRYFPDEVYSFAIKVLFKDGTESELYPIGPDGNGLLYFKVLSNHDLDAIYKNGFCFRIDSFDVSHISDIINNIDSIEFYRTGSSGNLITTGITFGVYNCIYIDGYYRYFMSISDDAETSYFIPVVDKMYFAAIHRIFAYIIVDNFNQISFPPNYPGRKLLVLVKSSFNYGGTYYPAGHYLFVSNGINYVLNEIENNTLFYYDVTGKVYHFKYQQIEPLGYLVYNRLTRLPIAKKDGNDYYYQYGDVSYNSEKPRIALFSPDFTSTQTLDNINCYIKKYAFLLNNRSGVKLDNDIRPEYYVVDTGDAFAYIDIGMADCSVYGINVHVNRGPDKFSSFFNDGDKYDRANGAAISFVPQGTDDKHYNRSWMTSPYIGVVLNSNINPQDYNRRYCALFKSDPDAFYLSYKDSFNPDSTLYEPIFRIKPSELNQTLLTKKFYGGDCFVQKTFIRALRWFGNDNNPDPGMKDKNGIFYQHGMLLGMISHNRINSQMRNPVGLIDNAERVYYYFFPYCEAIGKNTEDFIWRGRGSDYLFESYQVNMGYSMHNYLLSRQAVGKHTTIRYDFSNRMMLSFPNKVENTVNLNKILRTDSYADFNEGSSGINAIYKISSKFFLVFNDLLYEIYIKQARKNPNEFIFEDSGRVMDNFGAQSPFHTIFAENMVFGVDVERNIFWKVYLHITQGGFFIISAEDITTKLGVSKMLNDYLGNRIDSAQVKSGDAVRDIYIGYDPRYKEINISMEYEGDYIIHDYIEYDEVEEPVKYVTVNVTKVGNGTVSGGGIYTEGSVVVVTAEPDQGSKFKGWFHGSQLLSRNPVYRFVARYNFDLKAFFSNE